MRVCLMLFMTGWLLGESYPLVNDSVVVDSMRVDTLHVHIKGQHPHRCQIDVAKVQMQAIKNQMIIMEIMKALEIENND